LWWDEDVRERAPAGGGQLAVQLRLLAVDDLLAAARQGWEERCETAGVALRRDVALPHSVTIHAAPDRLAQVLGNLLSNALRHTSPGGTVTVSAATHGSTVEIAVADDGEGFSAEDRSRLFERFFRADSSRT